jgi:hypothetical protein
MTMALEHRGQLPLGRIEKPQQATPDARGIVVGEIAD